MRGKDQVLINFPAKESFVEMLDGALEPCGYSNRSSFIREAIMEKLVRMHIKVPPGIGLAPSRSGVGGKPTHAPYETTLQAEAMNDAPSSTQKELSPGAAGGVQKLASGLGAIAEGNKQIPSAPGGSAGKRRRPKSGSGQ